MKDWNDSVALAKAFGVLKSTGAVRHCKRFNQDFMTLVGNDLDHRPGHEPVAFDGMQVLDPSTRTVSWQFYHNPDREASRKLHCADIPVQREPVAATPMPDAKSIKDVKHAKN